MNILVTGGAGFIGSHLVENLVAQGHNVTVFDDFNDFYLRDLKMRNVEGFRDQIQLVEVDIRDKEQVIQRTIEGRFEKIVHLAARAGVRPSIEQPELYLETNINGTFYLLEAARQSGCEQFVLASSSSVYGLNKDVPFSESHPICETISPYAASKLACEQLCSNYAHLHGIRMLCLRFFTVYGPRQRPDLAIHKFTDRIYHGKPIPQYGDGSTGRDYTYVDDIVEGILGALRYDTTPFEIVNIGGNRVTLLRELIEYIEDALGKKATVDQMPEQAGDVPFTYADITKAERLFGYNPATPITEGVPKFVDWYLKHAPRNEQSKTVSV